jgi:hypothetical protein
MAALAGRALALVDVRFRRVTQKDARSAGDGRASGRIQTSPTIAESPQSSTPAAIERYANWFVIGRDATGKRISCRCAICGHGSLIGSEALAVGGVFCVGCPSPHSKAAEPAADSSFAANVAALEGWRAKRWRFGEGES